LKQDTKVLFDIILSKLLEVEAPLKEEIICPVQPKEETKLEVKATVEQPPEIIEELKLKKEENEHKRSYKRRPNRLCPKCKNPIENMTNGYCRECKNKYDREKRKQRKVRLCSKCRNPVDSHSNYCKQCRSEYNRKRREAKTVKLCSKCKTNYTTNASGYCKECLRKYDIERKKNFPKAVVKKAFKNNITEKVSRTYAIMPWSEEAIIDLSLMLNNNYQLRLSVSTLRSLMYPIIKSHHRVFSEKSLKRYYHAYVNYFVTGGLLSYSIGKANSRIYQVNRDIIIPPNKGTTIQEGDKIDIEGRSFVLQPKEKPIEMPKEPEYKGFVNDYIMNIKQKNSYNTLYSEKDIKDISQAINQYPQNVISSKSVFKMMENILLSNNHKSNRNILYGYLAYFVISGQLQKVEGKWNYIIIRDHLIPKKKQESRGLFDALGMSEMSP
jgi:predicted amidophosphoribosyltransferase